MPANAATPPHKSKGKGQLTPRDGERTPRGGGECYQCGKTLGEHPDGRYCKKKPVAAEEIVAVMKDKGSGSGRVVLPKPKGSEPAREDR